MPLPALIPLIASVAPAIYQGVKGLRQKNQAKKLKESNWIPPELMMNKDLANNQAFSRRAPGQSMGEERVRRTMANTISAGQRMAGGDVNKMAAITSAASSSANDANADLTAMGASFSEGAFNRLAGANNAIAGQKRINRAEYLDTKNRLDAAGDQNIFNSVNNLATGFLAGVNSGAFDGIDKGVKAAAKSKIAEGKFLNSMQAGRGAGGGMPYIKEGRAMMRNARRSMPGLGTWDSYMMTRYPQGNYGGGYGRSGGVWNMPFSED